MVEKDEPIPIVTNKPITNINKAANDLFSPIPEDKASTNVSTLPVAFITAANPAAAIIIKPIIAIM